MDPEGGWFRLVCSCKRKPRFGRYQVYPAQPLIKSSAFSAKGDAMGKALSSPGVNTLSLAINSDDKRPQHHRVDNPDRTAGLTRTDPGPDAVLRELAVSSGADRLRVSTVNGYNKREAGGVGVGEMDKVTDPRGEMDKVTDPCGEMDSSRACQTVWDVRQKGTIVSERRNAAAQTPQQRHTTQLHDFKRCPEQPARSLSRHQNKIDKCSWGDKSSQSHCKSLDHNCEETFSDTTDSSNHAPADIIDNTPNVKLNSSQFQRPVKHRATAEAATSNESVWLGTDPTNSLGGSCQSGTLFADAAGSTESDLESKGMPGPSTVDYCTRHVHELNSSLSAAAISKGHGVISKIPGGFIALRAAEKMDGNECTDSTAGFYGDCWTEDWVLGGRVDAIEGPVNANARCTGSLHAQSSSTESENDRFHRRSSCESVDAEEYRQCGGYTTEGQGEETFNAADILQFSQLAQLPANANALVTMAPTHAAIPNVKDEDVNGNNNTAIVIGTPPHPPSSSHDANCGSVPPRDNNYVTDAGTKPHCAAPRRQSSYPMSPDNSELNANHNTTTPSVACDGASALKTHESPCDKPREPPLLNTANTGRQAPPQGRPNGDNNNKTRPEDHEGSLNPIYRQLSFNPHGGAGTEDPGFSDVPLHTAQTGGRRGAGAGKTGSQSLHTDQRLTYLYGDLVSCLLRNNAITRRSDETSSDSDSSAELRHHDNDTETDGDTSDSSSSSNSSTSSSSSSSSSGSSFHSSSSLDDADSVASSSSMYPSSSSSPTPISPPLSPILSRCAPSQQPPRDQPPVPNCPQSREDTLGGSGASPEQFRDRPPVSSSSFSSIETYRTQTRLTPPPVSAPCDSHDGVDVIRPTSVGMPRRRRRTKKKKRACQVNVPPPALALL